MSDAAYTLRRPQLILSLCDYSGVWSQLVKGVLGDGK